MLAYRKSLLHLLLILLLAVSIVIVLAAAGQKQLPFQGDGHYYFLQTSSLLLDRDLDFQNNYRELGDPFHNARYECLRGIGNALLWMPFFYLAWLLSTIAGFHGAEQWLWLVGGCRVGTLFYALATGYLLFKMPSLRRIHALVRLILLVAVAAGTPYWHYVFRYPLYNHVQVAFLTSVFWYVSEWPRQADRPKHLLYSLQGLTLGLTLVTRPELAIFVLLFFLAPRIRKPAKERLRELGWMAGLALPFIGLQVALSYGKSLASSTVGLNLAQPQLANQLWSPRNGFVFQQPLVALGLMALLIVAWWKQRERVVVLCSFLVIWFESSASDYWAGGSIGARRLIPLLPFIYLGLSQIWIGIVQQRNMLLRQGIASSYLGLIFISSSYGASVLGVRREVAVERGQRFVETPVQVAVGKVTALPLLTWRTVRYGISLDQAYRLSWYTLLFHWPTQRGAVQDKLLFSTPRYHDLLLTQFSLAGKHHSVFLLPLHRTRPDRLGISLSVSDGVTVLFNGHRLEPAYHQDMFWGFSIDQRLVPPWVRLEVITNRPAALRGLILAAPGVPEMSR